MFASLPMYLRPDNRAAHESLWELIRDGLRARGIDAPNALDHDTDPMTGWARPDLVLGQMCNLPYRAHFRGKVTVLGCFDYGLPDTNPGYYRAAWIVRQDDPAQRPEECAGYRFARNEAGSNSGFGMAATQAYAMGLDLGTPTDTGGHLASIHSVATGTADFATIDTQTLWMARHDPATKGIKTIGLTAQTPGQSLITAPDRDPAPFRAALQEAVQSLSAEHRATLGIRGFVTLPDSAYDIPLPPKPALASA